MTRRQVMLLASVVLAMAGCSSGEVPSGSPPRPHSMAPRPDASAGPTARPTTAPPTPAPRPGSGAGSRAPVAPPGSILTAEVLEDGDGYVARLHAWSEGGVRISTLEAPFHLPVGFDAPTPEVVSPDGRLAISVAGYPGGTSIGNSVAILDLLDPPDDPVRVYTDEYWPTWTTGGDLVTWSLESSTGNDIVRLRVLGTGKRYELTQTNGISLRGVTDRPDGALILRDSMWTRWSILTWDGVETPVDEPPEPSLVTGIERMVSQSGETLACIDVPGTLETECEVKVMDAAWESTDSGLIGTARNGWFDLAWTRAGDAAVVVSRDQAFLVTRDGETLQSRVIAALPDVGRRRHWGIRAATDDHVVVSSGRVDRTGIVPLAGGEPVWIDGLPVGVIPG